jgi:integrase
MAARHHGRWHLQVNDLAPATLFGFAGAVIPSSRMKADRDHRVPLSPRALELLRQMEAFRPAGDKDGTALVFPGARAGRPMSDMTLAAVLRRMGQTGITVHGFRSAFRDWAEDCADAANGMIRSALAHTVWDKVDTAYRRGDAFDRRRKMMEQWEAFVNGEGQAGNE